MKIFTKKLIKLFISFSILMCLFYVTDFNSLLSSLRKANVFYLCIAFLLITINRILMPVKWNLLLRANSIQVSFYEVIRIYYISTFLGLYLPPTIGTDAVRTYYLSRDKYSVPSILASIVVERLLGFIALLFFLLVGCVFFLYHFSSSKYEITKVLFWGSLIAIFAVSGFVLSFSEIFSRVTSALVFRLSRRGVLTIAGSIDKLHNSYIGYKDKRLIMFVFFVLTCFEVALPIVRGYITALAFNTVIPLYYFFAFVPIILFLVKLPISVDGFGIHEGGFVYFLSLVGVSTSVGFTIGLANHFIFLIGLLPGAVFYIFGRKYESVRDCSRVSSSRA